MDRTEAIQPSLAPGGKTIPSGSVFHPEGATFSEGRLCARLLPPHFYKGGIFSSWFASEATRVRKVEQLAQALPGNKQ